MRFEPNLAGLLVPRREFIVARRPLGVPLLAIGAASPGFFAAAGGGGSGTTWSPTDRTAPWAVSNGNLRATGTGNAQAESIRCTRGSAAGEKLYAELPIINIGSAGYDDNVYWGLTTASQSITAIGSPYWLKNGAGTVYSAGGSGSGGSGATVNGDFTRICFEHDTGRLWVGTNTAWLNSGDPDAGTGYVWTFTSVASMKIILQTDGNNGGQTHVIDFNNGATYQGTKPSSATAW